MNRILFLVMVVLSSFPYTFLYLLNLAVSEVLPYLIDLGNQVLYSIVMLPVSETVLPSLYLTSLEGEGRGGH